MYILPCSFGSGGDPTAPVPGDIAVTEARTASLGEAPVETAEYVAVAWAEKTEA